MKMYRLLVVLCVYVIIQGTKCELCVQEDCLSEDSHPAVNINIRQNENQPVAGPGNIVRPRPGNPGNTRVRRTTPPVRVTQNKELENLSKKVAAFDKLMASYCIKNNNEVYETYGQDSYVLEYKLVGSFKAEDIDVKTKHRVVYVKGSDGQGGVLRDIRVVDDTLDVAQASWALAGDTLQIVIPYKTKNGQRVRKICNNVINNRTVTVTHDDGDLKRFYRKSS